jgi:hypothetical protein
MKKMKKMKELGRGLLFEIQWTFRSQFIWGLKAGIYQKMA